MARYDWILGLASVAQKRGSQETQPSMDPWNFLDAIVQRIDQPIAELMVRACRTLLRGC